MPIYAYRCESCGHAKDVLQKVSDPVLTTCPACNGASFKKQLTAAGFQLKGSGWYVTDFRGGNGGAKPDAAAPEAGKAGQSKADPAPAAGTAATATTAAAASSDSPATGGCGSSCACH